MIANDNVRREMPGGLAAGATLLIVGQGQVLQTRLMQHPVFGVVPALEKVFGFANPGAVKPGAVPPNWGEKLAAQIERKAAEKAAKRAHLRLV